MAFDDDFEKRFHESQERMDRIRKDIEQSHDRLRAGLQIGLPPMEVLQIRLSKAEDDKPARLLVIPPELFLYAKDLAAGSVIYFGVWGDSSYTESDLSAAEALCLPTAQ